MKRLIYLLSAVAILFIGCDKVEENPESGQEVGGITTEINALPEFIYASVTDEQGANTRTFVDENKKVLWQNGDAVSYFYGSTHNARYTYNGEDGKSSVELSLDNDKKGTTGALLLKSHAVYPYNENITAEYVAEEGNDKINLTFPTTQQYGENSFGKNANIMVAVGKSNTDDDLYFRNACGYLVIKLYAPEVNGKPTKIKSLTLSSVSGLDKIAGAATVVQDTFPHITMADDASSAVTLDCSNGGEGVTLGTSAQEATAFWFCLPPVTFTDGIKIIATDVNNNSFTKQTSKTVEIIRNEVQPMAALSFVSNTPAATKLWYTRAEGNQTPLNLDGDEFNASIIKHAWDASVNKIVIEFGSPVTTIKAFAFEGKDITTISMPEGFTTIEESAFEDAEYLSEITIPGSVTSIGVNAFWECVSLESVSFLPSETNTPLNICNMENAVGTDWGTFCDSKLTYINLNREINYVDEDGDKFTPDSDDDGLFYHENYGSVEKTTVIIGPQVKTLSYKMFQHLPVEEITIPGTVTTIENNVFEGCSKLKHLTFEPSADGTPLTMGYDDAGDDDGPFIDSPLETVELNRDIHYTFGGWTIDTDTEGLFGSKPTLTSVVLGEQVKSLTNNMFADAAITEIVIPGSVNTIGNDVFHQCTSLAKVTFEPSEEGTPLTMGYDTDGEDENLFQDNNVLTTLVLNREIIQTQTGVDTNSEGLFGGMSTLASITLGEQVKTLSTYMFAGAAIEEIVIPGTLTSIANNVFDACSNLKTITFEPSEEGTTLAIGYSGGSSLFASTPLEKVNLDRELNYLFPSSDLNDAAEGLFGNKTTLTSVTLGDNVKTLSPYMFAKSGITTLNLNKVETIEDNALASLALTSLTIPGNVMTIENNVFEGCKSLAEIIFLPHSEGEALKLGFYDATDDDGPFYDCPLTTVKLNRELDYTFPLSDLNDPNEGVFGNKTNLVSLTLGEQLKTLSPYMFANIGIKKGVGSSESNVVNANQYVLQLKNVETVGKNAFMGTQITNLKVYPSVSLIDDHAFANCESLVEVVLEASETPLNLGFQPGSNQYGPFWQSPLASVVLGREIAPTAAYASACDQPDEGIFSNEHSLEEVEGKLPVVQILANVKTLHPYMFSDWAMTSMTIPAFVTEIKDYAFYNCSKLADLTFADSNDDLIVGYQPGTNQRAPFYQSPLTNIVVNRSLVLSDAYASACDAADEGLFSTMHGSQSTTITLGGQVGKIPEFMFASLPLTSITIPATVTEISNDAFTDCKQLTSVIFEASAEPLTIGYNTIGDDEGLFAESPLTSVVLNRELNYTFPAADINDPTEGLFGNKTTLASLTLGENVKTISPYMFANAAITELDLNNVTTVGNYAFYNNSAIETVNLRQVTSIGNGAFEGVGKAATLDIPATVTSIGDFAFKGWESLATLNFLSGASDLTIGFQPGVDQRGPFYQSPLTTISVHRSLVLTDAYASACDGVDEGLFSTMHGSQSTTITLGGQVGKIPEFMFASLPLTSITIPATVTEIGNDAFTDCKSLSSVVFEASSTPITVGYNTVGDDEGLFVESPLTSVALYREIEYTFPGPDAVNEGLFGGKENLTNVTINDNVKTISPYMFANSAITALDLKSVETIGNAALMGADFETLIVPASVNSIGDYAFANCESLKNLTFEANTKELTIGFEPGTNEHGPFYQSPLENVVVNRGIVLTEEYFKACDSSNEGIFATIHGNQNTSVSLGGLVTSIPKFMFSQLPINTITIPATVNSIGENAFQDCEALTELNFEAGPESLKIYAQWVKISGKTYYAPFYDSPLSKIYLGRDIEYVSDNGNAFVPTVSSHGLFNNDRGGDIERVELTFDPVYGPKTFSPYMFSGVKMESVKIPAYVNEIGNNAFELCDKLSTITFEQSANTLNMGYYVGFGGMIFGDAGPFYSCPLTTVNLYREINYTFGGAVIDDAAEGLFGNKTTLANVTLGDDVKTISPYMFANSAITSLDLKSVVTIGNYALKDADFASLTIPGTVTEIGNNVFEACSNLASITFEPSATGAPLTMGYYDASDDDGPFYSCPLSSVNLNREINYTFPNPNADSEGVFGGKSSLTNVSLGDQVRTLSPYMFASSAITSLDLKNVVTIDNYALKAADFTSITIPASVSSIDGYAFYDCSSLSSLKFESGSEPLTIGAQIGSSDVGPFWQSPLSIISLDRELVMDDEYAKYCDDWDEGVFSNKYYDDANQPEAKLSLGNNVKTILPYMIAATRIQQLHLPESVDKIGKNVIERCELLNAIVFYDLEVRPEVETGAFGTAETLLANNCFLFMPWRTVNRTHGSLYYNIQDEANQTYWHVLYPTMVDEDANNKIEYRTQPHDESLYLDVPGYEWYRKRYYNQEIITPPVF